MAKIDIEQIKADREAGTQGPWRVEVGSDFSGEFDVWIGGPREEGSGTIVCACWDDDANRIARVPDYEDALIEAVELLERYAAGIGFSEIEGQGVDCAQFLERFK